MCEWAIRPEAAGVALGSIGGLESCTVAERAQSRVFFFVTYFYNCPEAAGVALGSINGLESCTVAERAQSRVFLFVTYFYRAVCSIVNSMFDSIIRWRWCLRIDQINSRAHIWCPVRK